MELTSTADYAPLQGCSKLSTNANQFLGLHLDDLPPSCERLLDVLLEAVSVESIEHIA